MAPAAKRTKTAPAASPATKEMVSRFFSGGKAGAAPAPAAPIAAEAPPVAEAPTPEAKSTPEAKPATTPVRAEAKAAPTPEAPAPGDAQRQRIEENRRAALERKRAREEVEAAAAQPPPEDDRAAKAAAKAAPKAKSRAKGKAKAAGRASAEAATPEKVPAPAAATAPSPAKAGEAKADTRPRAEEWRQYAGLYAARLRQLRGAVSEEARAVWGGRVAPQGFRAEVCGYRQGGAGEVVVFGILFKEMGARENVICLYRENQLKSHIPGGDPREPGSLCSDDDALFIEDATMRLRLRAPPAAVERLCTGLVAAVLGVPTVDGCLAVDRPEDVVLARLPPPRPLRLAPAAGPCLALACGLGGAAQEAALERLVALVATEEVRRLVVCGALGEDGEGGWLSRDHLAKADTLYARLAASAEVHVMPGRADPTNLSLPQMPLHPCLFRKAREAGGGGFRCVGNPYSAALEGSDLAVLGHSGQPVEDVLRCTRGRRPLDALRLCLEAMHLAPTAPDTLPAPPFEGEDPLVIREVPHLLFSGGHGRAEHDWSPAPRGEGPASGTQLVAVPEFRRHPAVVLVSLADPRDVRVHELGA